VPEGIQDNIPAKDIVAEPPILEPNPELALAGLEAFELLNIQPLTQIVWIGSQNLFEMFYNPQGSFVFFGLPADLLLKERGDLNQVCGRHELFFPGLNLAKKFIQGYGLSPFVLLVALPDPFVEFWVFGF